MWLNASYITSKTYSKYSLVNNWCASPLVVSDKQAEQKILHQYHIPRELPNESTNPVLYRFHQVE